MSLRSVFMTTFLLFVTLGASAEPTGKTQKIEWIIDRSNLKAQAEQMSNVVYNSINQQFEIQSLPEEYKAVFDDFMDGMMEVVFDEMLSPEFRPDLIAAYDNTYSASEIDALYAFYATPTGSVILEKQALLNAEVAQAGLDMMERIQPEILMLQNKMMRDLRALNSQ